MAFLPSFTIFIIFNLALFHEGFAEVIYEDGYTVTTVLDGNKLKINPHSIALRSRSHDLILLDSLNSLFYSLSLPLSQESVVRKFAGNGVAGFSDGNTGSAMFDKPRSFAMDFKGNVYVADRRNFAVRKISESGVTTIAGGNTAGRIDGPGRNATFSSDYELSFVPDMCALLILDHGNKLIRHINLKREDCGSSESGVGNAIVWPWVMAAVVSCLVGLVIGFFVRPYITLHEEDLNLINSWMIYLMSLGRRTRMCCFGTRNAVANPTLKFMRTVILLIFSHLSLMSSLVFKRVDSNSSTTTTTVDKDYSSSLLDSDSVRSQKYADQMRDLISFEEHPIVSDTCNEVEDVTEKDEHSWRQIDDLMQANITNFVEDACKLTVLEGRFLGVSTVVKRR